MTTGEKLQKLRKENNYTQEELAEILDVSRQSISKWESDGAFPETDKLITLSKLYHCTVDYLLNNDNDDPTTLNHPEELKEKDIITNHGKKRVPFVLTTTLVLLATLILFFLPWFKTQEYYSYSLNAYVYTYTNFYEVVFFIKTVEDSFIVGNIFALLAFIAIIIDLILSLFYVFYGKKELNITIKIVNITIPLFIFAAMMFFKLEWIITGAFVGLLYLALIICQFAIPTLRKTYSN